MRILGCSLLLSGWLIILATFVMLGGAAERVTFVTAGFAVELLGLCLLFLGHSSSTGAIDELCNLPHLRDPCALNFAGLSLIHQGLGRSEAQLTPCLVPFVSLE